MNCPLLSKIDEPWGIQKVPCMKDECAWYISDGEGCAIKSLANSTGYMMVGVTSK